MVHGLLKKYPGLNASFVSLSLIIKPKISKPISRKRIIFVAGGMLDNFSFMVSSENMDG